MYGYEDHLDGSAELSHDSGEDDSPDEDVDEEAHTALKRELETCLSSKFAAGAFATWLHAHSYVNPGLHIEGLGRIGLPISSPECQRMITMARKAPFGKGSETIVDQSVRKTWEIDGSLITMQHPGYKDWLDRTLKEVVATLGVDTATSAIAAPLYKLLIYEKDSHFSPHRE